MKANDGVVFRAVRLAWSVVAMLGVGLLTGVAGAQNQPAAPTKQSTPAPSVNLSDWFARGGLVCGGGASTSTVATKPTLQCGGIFGIGFLDIEAGVMGPQANRSPVSGYLSTNLWLPLEFNNKHGTPVIVSGYTRMFETGNALDYGLAYARAIDDYRFIQFEVRDYWAFANPSQHDVVFRVALFAGGPDD